MADSYPTDDGASPRAADDADERDLRVNEGADDESQGEDDQELIDKARACLALAQESETEIRKLALEDIVFSTGKQWPDNIQQDRQRDGRPCLVINRIPQFVQQITNDQRQNRPSIKVHPVGDGADVETAKIIQGLTKHIEYNSNADVAYDTAFDSAARGGFGFWRVVTDFVGEDTFDQDIFIKRIKNPFSVYLDPSAQEPDGSDANWGFILDYIAKDEYKEKYPDSDLATSGDWDSVGNSAPAWMRDGAACVAEYFYKAFEDKTVHLLSTGETVADEDLESRLAEAKAAQIDAQVVKSRSVKVPTIKWVKMNAVEVLERTDWPGKYIPIVPVYGGEVHVDGKTIREGIVRNAKDAQRMYNYWKSAETEAIALAPKAPFIVAEGQIENYKEMWETANRRNHAYLPYKPTTIAGMQAPPPQRQAFEPAVQAITQAASFAADDLKATTGIYDASLGAQSPDASGIAIQRRNTQAQTSNFHFIDNLTRSLRHTGRILIDLIPKIYDTARTARIIAEDGTQKIVPLNQAHQDDNGDDALYQLDAGTYDVTVDVGPSYASKRQEASASMQSLAQSYPKVMDIAGDLFVKNMDWPGAQDIAERIKRTLPPQLVNDPGKGAQQIPPQVQAQMQQMGQMVEQLSRELNAANQVIETRQLEHQSRERIEFAKLQVDAEIQMAKMGSNESLALLDHKISEIDKRLKLIGFDQPYGDAPQNLQPQPSASPAQPGGSPAPGGQGTQTPTGGQSPGQPME